MPLSPDQPLVRRGGVLGAPVDDEIVLMSPELGHYLALSAEGKRIWELLETPLSPAQLAERLAAQFEATADQILADVTPFLEELRRDGLIELA